MPLSKAKQAEYMRNYRAEKKGEARSEAESLGITHRKTREFTNPVIPKAIDNTKHIIDLMKTLDGLDIEYIDADGYPVYDD